MKYVPLFEEFVLNEANLNKTKAVDSRGKPMKVYHGQCGDFKPKNGPEIFFSSVRQVAESYAIYGATNSSKQPIIVTAYLNLPNPTFATPEDIEYGDVTYEDNGTILEDVYDGIGTHAVGVKSNIYVVRKKNQIVVDSIEPYDIQK